MFFCDAIIVSNKGESLKKSVYEGQTLGAIAKNKIFFK
jgi:hypothetical protein